MILATYTDAFLTNLDGLLQPICEKLQLPPSSHSQVDDRYRAVGKWLHDCPTLSLYDLLLFPQGSYAIGTTVRPLYKKEFDLDFVLLLQKNFQVIGAIELLNLLEKRLRAHGTYAGMVERKNRCLRLRYANFFHMDILPAKPNDEGYPGCLLVPDRKAEDWKHSNPKGFRNWFKNQSVAHQDFREQELLPTYQGLEEKSTLQCVVQLFKRWRDVHYVNKMDQAPVSIVLTTLAGRYYVSQDSVEHALEAVLTGIGAEISSVPYGQRLRVTNPSNSLEDLSERWNDPACYKAFTAGINTFQEEWRVLRNASGLDERVAILKRLFGQELTETVVRDQATRLSDTVREGRMGALRRDLTKPGIIVPASTAGAAAIRPHTFYGDGDD